VIGEILANNDPIKKIIQSKNFNIYIWDEPSRIIVSWKNRTMAFLDWQDVLDINELTTELIKNEH
jgi:hypothetical protein